MTAPGDVFTMERPALRVGRFGVLADDIENHPYFSLPSKGTGRFSMGRAAPPWNLRAVFLGCAVRTWFLARLGGQDHEIKGRDAETCAPVLGLERETPPDAVSVGVFAFAVGDVVGDQFGIGI